MIVQLSVVFIVFLQLADVVRVDHLTRSDGFLNLLHSKRPNLTANLRRINNAVSAIFMGLIASGSALAGLIFVLKVNTAQDRPQLVRAPELDDLNKSGPNT